MPTIDAVPSRSDRRWALKLTAEDDSPARARVAVRAWLGLGDPELRIDASLVASELVTNAVKYGREPILLVANVDERGVRLEVCDGGTQRPRRRRPGLAGGGWGLPIVQRLGERWGTAASPTSVWCELHRDDTCERSAGGRSRRSSAAPGAR